MLKITKSRIKVLIIRISMFYVDLLYLAHNISHLASINFLKPKIGKQLIRWCILIFFSNLLILDKVLTEIRKIQKSHVKVLNLGMKLMIKN